MFKKWMVLLAGILIIVSPMYVYSQVKKVESSKEAEPATKLEQFLSKKGRLY